MQREHFSEFPSANIINSLKLEQWQNLLSDSYDRIASNNATLGFCGGGGGGYSGKGKSYVTTLENIVSRYQTLVSSPLPPPPHDDRFFCTDDRKSKL